MSTPPLASDLAPLGIIAGAGTLPFEVAEAVRTTGRSVYILGIEGFVSDAIRAWPHGMFRLGTIAAPIRLLREATCTDLVLTGRVERPNLTNLRIDGKAITTLPKILAVMKRGGDDTMLSGLIGLIEDEGFRVVGIPEIAPALVAGTARIGTREPSKADLADMEIGFQALKHMGSLDIGQAVVVIDQRIVAVEAAEGTDAMVRRVVELRKAGRVRGKTGTGVLVKAPKPGQDLRIDMPVIGPETARAVSDARLAGIGIEAGGVLIAGREALEKEISDSGLFLVGRTKK